MPLQELHLKAWGSWSFNCSNSRATELLAFQMHYKWTTLNTEILHLSQTAAYHLFLTSPLNALIVQCVVSSILICFFPIIYSQYSSPAFIDNTYQVMQMRIAIPKKTQKFLNWIWPMPHLLLCYLLASLYFVAWSSSFYISSESAGIVETNWPCQLEG